MASFPEPVLSERAPRYAELQVEADAGLVVDEVGRVLVLGVDHQGEVAQAQQRQRHRAVLLGLVDLADLGAEDLVVELVRLHHVVDVQKRAGDLGRHPPPHVTSTRARAGPVRGPIR